MCLNILRKFKMFFSVYFKRLDFSNWRFKMLILLLYDFYLRRRMFHGTIHIFYVIIINSKRVTIFRHLQSFWGASGNFWQNQWDNVYELFGRNDLAVGVIGIYNIVYQWKWGLGLSGLTPLSTIFQGPSWSWAYGSWIYNYLCNQCLWPLKLWVQTSFIVRCTQYNIMW
jgi:hypothetical protein